MIFYNNVLPPLVKTSTSDTDAFVAVSVDLKIVCPTKLDGSPVVDINSATITSLLINSADDGFIKLPSKSKIVVSTPYNTLNKFLLILQYL